MVIENRVLVTGGTGSWGRELTRRLLTMPSVTEVVVLSRSENNQFDMRRDHRNDRVRFVLGDIRDYNTVRRAMANVKVAFHLAAMKHVEIAEMHPAEAIATNILGTQNVANAALDAGVELVVDVSTDKAVDPMNTYGLTKALGERIMTQSNDAQRTKFVSVRGGNVVGTRGTVIPIFRQQILQSNVITVTDPDMTRFMMTRPEAIDLLIMAAESAVGGETYVMKMKGVSIGRLAQSVIDRFGNESTRIDVIGARRGERKHELLASRFEANRTFEFGDWLVVIPEGGLDAWKAKALTPTALSEFSSEFAEPISDAVLAAYIESDSVT